MPLALQPAPVSTLRVASLHSQPAPLAPCCVRTRTRGKGASPISEHEPPHSPPLPSCVLCILLLPQALRTHSRALTRRPLPPSDGIHLLSSAQPLQQSVPPLRVSHLRSLIEARHLSAPLLGYNGFSPPGQKLERERTRARAERRGGTRPEKGELLYSYFALGKVTL